MKRRRQALRRRGSTEHFAAARLIKPNGFVVVLVEIANRFEQAQNSDAGHIGGIFRLIERDFDVALRAQIINLVGAHFFEYSTQTGRVAQVAVMQFEAAGINFGIVIQMVDALRPESRGAAHDAVNFVNLFPAAIPADNCRPDP